MEEWNYRGISIRQTSHKNESSRWLSTARFRTPQCGFDLTAYPAREFDGFGDPKNAEQATEIFARNRLINSRLPGRRSLKSEPLNFFSAARGSLTRVSARR